MVALHNNVTLHKYMDIKIEESSYYNSSRFCLFVDGRFTSFQISFYYENMLCFYWTNLHEISLRSPENMRRFSAFLITCKQANDSPNLHLSVYFLWTNI